MAAHSEYELHQVVWIMLTAVKNLQVGKLRLAAFLKGSKSKVVMPISDKNVYGGLMWCDIATITGFIEQLENMNLIQRKTIQGYPYSYSVFELSDAGRLVLDEKREIPLQVIKEIKPISVGGSEIETYELLKQGKSISEISHERKLTLSTIYAHAFRLISVGRISSYEVISEEIISKVADISKKISDPSVKKVKELLPELSYEEIRCVLAGLRKNEN